MGGFDGAEPFDGAGPGAMAGLDDEPGLLEKRQLSTRLLVVAEGQVLGVGLAQRDGPAEVGGPLGGQYGRREAAAMDVV